MFINYLYFHHMCFILSDLKCYGSASLSSRNHFWKAKENEWWKNNNNINKLSNLQNMFFFSLDPLAFKPYNFFISYSF